MTVTCAVIFDCCKFWLLVFIYHGAVSQEEKKAIIFVPPEENNLVLRALHVEGLEYVLTLFHDSKACMLVIGLCVFSFFKYIYRGAYDRFYYNVTRLHSFFDIVH